MKQYRCTIFFVTYFPISNLFSLFSLLSNFNRLVAPCSPVFLDIPWSLISTLQSVPAPNDVPVSTIIVYWGTYENETSRPKLVDQILNKSQPLALKYSMNWFLYVSNIMSCNWLFTLKQKGYIFWLWIINKKYAKQTFRHAKSNVSSLNRAHSMLLLSISTCRTCISKFPLFQSH